MREYFILNGVDSRDFGVYISGQGTFSAPQKAYQFYNIPGRNGALLGNEHRLENIEISYEAFIYADFDNQIAAFRSFLLSLNGYVKLTDSYHPDEYRMAAYVGPFEPKVQRTNDAGSFTITFSCKPQRWLLDGETWYRWSGSTVMLSGEEITSSYDADNDYATLSFVGRADPAITPSPSFGNDISTPSKVAIWQGSTVLYEASVDPDYTVVSYNLLAGTGTATQKKRELTSGWGYAGSGTFGIASSDTLVWCSHYKKHSGTITIPSSLNNNEWCQISGHVYVRDNRFISNNHQTDVANFINFLTTKSVKFTFDLATAESTTITAYTPAISGPFTVKTMYYQSIAGWRAANDVSSIDLVLGLKYTTDTVISTMVNPTVFNSKPMIRAYGVGSFKVNDITITISSSTSYVDIDCEMMDCFEGSTNRNGDVSFSTYDFPELIPGENPVTLISGVTEVDIQPRWWRV